MSVLGFGPFSRLGRHHRPVNDKALAKYIKRNKRFKEMRVLVASDAFLRDLDFYSETSPYMTLFQLFVERFNDPINQYKKLKFWSRAFKDYCKCEMYNARGDSLLMYCVSENKEELLDMLLSMQIPIDLDPLLGTNIVHYISFRAPYFMFKILDYLIQQRDLDDLESVTISQAFQELVISSIQLIELGFDLSNRLLLKPLDESKPSAIHTVRNLVYSIENGEMVLVNPSLKRVRYRGRSLMEIAIDSGNVALVKSLYQMYSKEHLTNYLMYSIQRRQLKVLEFLSSSEMGRDHYLMDLLVSYALTLRVEEALEWLFQWKISPEKSPRVKDAINSAIQRVFSAGFASTTIVCCKLVLNHGFNVDSSIFEYTHQINSAEQLEFFNFLAQKVDWNGKYQVNGESVLVYGAKNGPLSLLQLASDKGLSFDDDQLLNHCIKANSLERVQFIATKTSINSDALHVAVTLNRLEIAQFLLEKGANVDLKDNLGNTPLHVACINGNVEMIQLLLEKGANVNIRNSENRLATDLAVSEGNIPELE